MTNIQNDFPERLAPPLPSPGARIRLLIDTDAATEIDDLYAVALALVSPERFYLEGLVATHFSHGGPESIEQTYALLLQLLEVAGMSGCYPVTRGGHPMQYLGYPSPSAGADFIIERAYCGTEDNPLWVVGLGAATNIASALLKDPGIAPRIRCVYHARSHMSWPERSIQYNVAGDVLAARTLLLSAVPLVWFDTGTYICASMDTTEKHVASTGRLGKFLHDYRYKHPWYMQEDKGFFDLGDIAWLLNPDLGKMEIVPAPSMGQDMHFDHAQTHGNMLRVYDIDSDGVWDLLFEGLKRK